MMVTSAMMVLVTLVMVARVLMMLIAVMMWLIDLCDGWTTVYRNGDVFADKGVCLLSRITQCV